VNLRSFNRKSGVIPKDHNNALCMQDRDGQRRLTRRTFRTETSTKSQRLIQMDTRLRTITGRR
jgi:hypothetical protein